MGSPSPMEVSSMVSTTMAPALAASDAGSSMLAARMVRAASTYLPRPGVYK
jgi:hypothetical protein